MKSKLLSFIAALILVFAYSYLFRFPQEASEAVVRGLRLCATVVLPSLFPFFVLTNCVVFSGITERLSGKLGIFRVFRLNKYGASAMLLGLLGGYPLGAKALASFVRANKLSERQVSSYLPLCNNGGAALFLSMIGNKLFGSVRIGAALYCIHIISSFLLAFCFRPNDMAQVDKAHNIQPSSIHFVASVQDAASTALTVSAFIVIFAVISQAVDHIPIPTCFTSGLLELSGGCYAAATASLTLSIRAALCSLFAGWGGICVHAQTAAVLDGINIDFPRYFAIKLLHGFLAFFLTMLYSRLWHLLPNFSFLP